MQPQIIPERLVTLRKRLGLSQQSLAEQAGLSRRQIAALEKPLKDKEQRVSRANTLKALALALRVKREVLTGLADMPAEKQETEEIIVRLTPLALLNYDRIKRRYGVSRDEIIEAAPLLFTILAEQSLKAREDKQKERDAFMANLKDMVIYRGMDLTTWLFSYDPNEDDETQSIAEPDVFGRWHSDTFTLTNNPFVDFLLEAARDPRVKAQVTFEASYHGGGAEEYALYADWTTRFPVATVCETEEARLARESDDRRIDDINLLLRRPDRVADQSLAPERAA